MIDALAARRELADMHRSLDYFSEADCNRANELIDIIEGHMATKSIGAVSKKALGLGKVQPIKKTPPHFASAKQAKADRVEAGLRRNRATKRGA
jgi:hypothetical protein